MKKSDDELKVSTNLNESTAERQLKFKTIIEALRQLNADQAYEHCELYIKMCRQNPLSYVSLDQNIEIFDKIGKPINNTPAKIEPDDTCDWDVKEIGKPTITPNVNSNSGKDLDVKEIGTQSNTPATTEPQNNCDFDVKKIDVPINNIPATMEQIDKNCDSDAETIKTGVHKTKDFETKFPDTKQLTQNKRGREKDDDRFNNISPNDNTVDKENEKMMPKKPKLLSNIDL